MGSIATERILEVAGALRKRAAFFRNTDPQELSAEDFATIGTYLDSMAETLHTAVKGNRRKAFGRGLLTSVLYLGLFGALCWAFYQYSPFEDRYYLKLAQEIFTEQDAPTYVFYIRAGIAAFCSLFLFFISVFVSIIFCGILKLALPRLINSVTEALVAAVLAGTGFYFYHEYVFITGLAKSFL